MVGTQMLSRGSSGGSGNRFALANSLANPSERAILGMPKQLRKSDENPKWRSLSESQTLRAEPELKNVVFHFQRVSSTIRTISLNGSVWRQLENDLESPEVDSITDGGPEGRHTDAIARDLLSVVFDPDTPGYGRMAGRVSSDELYIQAVVQNLLIQETRSSFSITDTDLLALAPSHIEILPARERPTWAKVGDKLRFIEPRMVFHTDIYENAKRLLVPGQIYTISYIECALSWTAVCLEETGDARFNYHSFKRL